MDTKEWISSAVSLWWRQGNKKIHDVNSKTIWLTQYFLLSSSKPSNNESYGLNQL